MKESVQKKAQKINKRENMYKIPTSFLL